MAAKVPMMPVNLFDSKALVQNILMIHQRLRDGVERVRGLVLQLGWPNVVSYSITAITRGAIFKCVYHC